MYSLLIITNMTLTYNTEVQFVRCSLLIITNMTLTYNAGGKFMSEHGSSCTFLTALS